MNNIHCSADYIAHLLRQGLDEEELQKKLRAYNEAVQQQREQWELQVPICSSVAKTSV